MNDDVEIQSMTFGNDAVPPPPLLLPFIRMPDPVELRTDSEELARRARLNAPRAYSDFRDAPLNPDAQPFADRDEMVAAMADARYQSDPNYRAAVYSRLAASGGEAPSRALTVASGKEDSVLEVRGAAEPFSDTAEMHAAFADPKYSDPGPIGEAFRARVVRRLAASTL